MQHALDWMYTLSRNPENSGEEGKTPAQATHQAQAQATQPPDAKPRTAIEVELMCGAAVS